METVSKYARASSRNWSLSPITETRCRALSAGASRHMKQTHGHRIIQELYNRWAVRGRLRVGRTPIPYWHAACWEMRTPVGLSHAHVPPSLSKFFFNLSNDGPLSRQVAGQMVRSNFSTFRNEHIQMPLAVGLL